MRRFTGKRYWLIGASEGLGRAVATRLADAGAEVIVSARSEDRLKELAAEIGPAATPLPVDVSDSAGARDAANAAGELDGMVYLAGVYWPMPATEWEPDKAEMMADINYTGCMRAVSAVLPGMVERGAGHIVITGSLSGFRGLATAIGYGSSKAGCMYMAEALHAELRGTGVDVQLINPGFIKTRLTDKNDFTMPFIMEPGDAAREYVDHMRTDRFKKSFPTAFSLMFRLSQFLPDWAYYRTLGKGG
ncbi:SDR family NAD(P)-dependent oxidoreductase [Ovoidimarina sediminis]|uniref:SDR family NAD(P)-dependent oxidoreductase n=1 Tax=Ovoidimarina sediminis TaxID=3079856 RepID=UPI0029080F84|nr:SDR family NAD(P)-dependent oxidoreductase [Rhodophyticola sp. MJ-SS7]MDU8942654.1 SDR family NAD(P)-dependent oxidoreductase [Rhodophyticola sp. MJ-SS7]